MLRRVLEVPDFRQLAECMYKSEAGDAPHEHALRVGILYSIRRQPGLQLSLQTLEGRYTYHKLRPLLESRSCSTMKIVVGVGELPGPHQVFIRGYNFARLHGSYAPNDREKGFFERIAHHTVS